MKGASLCDDLRLQQELNEVGNVRVVAGSLEFLRIRLGSEEPKR